MLVAPPDGTLYAFAAPADPGNGPISVWEYDTGNSIVSCPALTPNGSVVVTVEGGTLLSLDASDGSFKWEFDALGATVLASPAVDASGEGRSMLRMQLSWCRVRRICKLTFTEHYALCGGANVCLILYCFTAHAKSAYATAVHYYRKRELQISLPSLSRAAQITHSLQAVALHSR